ncbi:MAG TPA: sulfotransferase [Tahibacter sp.]|nr:sulfotransferase [Tahibacter sp.]
MQLFVCGMHRSGTSMVARLLNLMGLYFGPEGSALPANRENPKGFWERRDVVALNDQLLMSADSTWFNIYAFVARTAAWRPPQSLVDALRAKVLDIDAHRPWFVKDPRFCLTLPYWLEHCERPVAVICSRSPESVIASLAKRTEITGLVLTRDESLALWEAYNVELLRASRGVPCVFVRYEDVLESPLDACTRLAAELSRLGLRGMRDVDPPSVQAFVDARLQRSDAATAPPPPRIGEIDRRVVGADADAAPPKISGESLAALSRLHERLGTDRDLLRVLSVLALRRGDIEAAIEKRLDPSEETAWSVDALRRLAGPGDA